MLGSVMRPMKAKSSRSCRNPAWLSVKLLINYSVLPWSHWITGNNLKASVSKKKKKLPSIPTWEYYLPWELLNSTQQVHSKLVFCPCQEVAHIKVVLTFKSPFSACFHQTRLVIAFSWKSSSNPLGLLTDNKKENSGWKSEPEAPKGAINTVCVVVSAWQVKP